MASDINLIRVVQSFIFNFLSVSTNEERLTEVSKHMSISACVFIFQRSER